MLDLNAIGGVIELIRSWDNKDEPKVMVLVDRHDDVVIFKRILRDRLGEPAFNFSVSDSKYRLECADVVVSVQSITSWLQQRGLRMPTIYYLGCMGEHEFNRMSGEG